MYVCICNAITERQVLEAVKDGANSLLDLQAELGVATGCGSCADAAADVLRQNRAGGQRPAEPRIHVPSVA